MANLVMESFQTVNFPYETKVFSRFTNSIMVSGGRDGFNIAKIGAVYGQGTEALINNDSSGGLYWGMRLFPGGVYGEAPTNTSPLSLYFQDEDGELIHVYLRKGLLRFPHNDEWITLNENSLFLELGMDDIYFEMRFDNQTVLRWEHKHKAPTKCGIYVRSGYNQILPIQDFYINNKNGGQNNSFLGDIKIDAYPVNADGSLSSGFASGSGKPLYEAVKDLPVDTQDWVEASAIGSQVTFNIEDMPEDEIPLAVKIVSHASKMAGSDTGIKLLAKEGENLYKSGKITLPVQGTRPASAILDQAPGGGNWTPEAVNTLEIGMEIVE